MDAENKKEDNAGQSWVERLPEAFRKKIWIFSTAIITLIIFFVWLASFKNYFTITPTAADPNMEALKSEVADLATTVAASWQKLTAATSTEPETAATGTILTAADITSLKDKLLDRQMAGWLIYADAANGFSLKYPADFKISTSTAADPALVAVFSREGGSLTLKKYWLIEEFFSRPNLKKYFSLSQGYLAVFDTTNGSSTELMINSLEILK